MAEPAASPGSGSPAGAVAMLAAMAGIMLPILLAALFQSKPTIADCGRPDAPLTEATGTLRQAGADFYLAGDGGWQLVRSRCASKSRDVCTPAIRQDETWLASHLGEAVSARRCVHGIVEYTVAGRTFHR